MSEESFELRVSIRKLLIGLLLTVIPISLAGLFSITQSDKALEKMIGGHFKTIAESSSAEISHLVHDWVIEVTGIAMEPAIVDAVAAANRAYQGMNDDAVSARIQKIDQQWATPASDASVKEVLSTPASRLLRRHREHDPRLLRITVTDGKGATIAATHKTLDYYQADEEYWQNIYAQGRGAVSLTDILYDEATKSHYIGVGVPVLEEGTNRFIGTADALVDVSSIFPAVNRVQIGPSGRTLLVKEDGTVISASQAILPLKAKSDEYAAFLDAKSTLPAMGSGYLVADLRGAGRNLIGFADTGLKQNYPNLGWFVLVSQDAREAFAPIRLVGRLFGFVSLLGLASVTILAAYFALHRRRPFTEIGELRQERSQTAQA